MAVESVRYHSLWPQIGSAHPPVPAPGAAAEAQRRASAFGRALDLHLTKLREEPGAYGQLGLGDLFELREECLREFGFADVYRWALDIELGLRLCVGLCVYVEGSGGGSAGSK